MVAISAAFEIAHRARTLRLRRRGRAEQPPGLLPLPARSAPKTLPLTTEKARSLRKLAQVVLDTVFQTKRSKLLYRIPDTVY